MRKVSEKISDREILEGIKASRNDILEYVYQQFYPMIYQYVITNNGNTEEARDIFQDGIFVLYEKTLQSDFRLTASIGTFLYSVCKNLWRNKLNRQKSREDLQKNIPEQPEELDIQQDESTERQHLLKQLFQQIGETCRQILMKKYYEKLKDKEIAEKLNLSGSDYVKTQRYRCLKQLRKLYDEKINLKD
ncbi:MAG: RNA polymerase sigma factor [Bacteroidales bacterium]